jgi:hypothetical protein
MIIPLSIGAFSYRRLHFEIRLLLLLFLIAAMVEGNAFYLVQNHKNAYWLYHVYMPLEYGLLAVIFSFWQKKQWMRTALRSSIPLFVLICIWDMVVNKNLEDLNYFTASIAFTLYVGISSVTLLYLLTDNSRSIIKDCRFWVGAALLIYSAGGLAYFSFHKTIVGDFLIGIWVIHSILNIVAYILYSVGIICQAR